MTNTLPEVSFGSGKQQADSCCSEIQIPAAPLLLKKWLEQHNISYYRHLRDENVYREV